MRDTTAAREDVNEWNEWIADRRALVGNDGEPHIVVEANDAEEFVQRHAALADEVDRLKKESFDYRDAWMELSAKHEALLAAAKEWERWNPPQQVTAPHIEGLRAAIADCGGDDE